MDEEMGEEVDEKRNMMTQTRGFPTEDSSSI